MTLALDIGLLHPLYKFLGVILAFFYSLIPNIGFAIFMLTVLIMLALFPLTAKQAKAMVKLQLVQPEIKKIQNQYKDDRQKMNEEVMRYYQENKINPFAGCLPLLLQMPILVALYETILNVQKWVPTDSALYRAFCGDLAASACTGNAIKSVYFLGMSVRTSASKSTSLGFGDAWPYFALVLLVVFLGLLQGLQTQRSQVGQAPNKQMVIIGRIMPIFFGFIAYGMPSGLVLYFATSSAWRLGQQELIYRKITTPMRDAADQKKQADPTAEELEEPTANDSASKSTPARKRKRRR
ncbi:MAG: YidC/Oxa1 family membrane protein insertase [Acidimicrobiia bacterium]